MKKRILSMILVLGLALNVLPMAVFAAEDVEIPDEPGWDYGPHHPDGLHEEWTDEPRYRNGFDPENPPAMPFADIPDGHWAFTAISYCSFIGIIKGYDDGLFHPEDTVTVAEFIAIIIRQNIYRDIRTREDGEPWYMPEWEIAESRGILDDTSLSIADAGKGITRYDMAQILRNERLALGHEGITGVEPPWEATDIDDVPDGYRDAVCFCIAKRFVYGYEDGTFRGTNVMTRAEAAEVITRFNTSRNC